jgi:ankyrin repeat protein
MAGAYSATELKEKKNEWLLAERGRRPQLRNADTHAEIESEMLLRGMDVPAIPDHPLCIVPHSAWPYGLSTLAFGLFETALFSILVAKTGLVVALIVCAILIKLFFDFLANLSIPPNALPKDAKKALVRGRKDNVTELMITAAVGDVSRISDLLNYGAVIDGKTKNCLTPLMYAASCGQENAYRYLLSRGADASARSSRGLTAGEIAAEKGYMDFLKAP